MRTYTQSRLSDGQKILFIGDSITDCDRTTAPWRPLGFGYVGLFSDLLAAREPEKRIEVINTGINSNTIAHLLSRWCDDVLEYEPDVISILIGINDVTRYLDGSASLHSSPDKFRQIYHQLLSETAKRLPDCQILLMEPFFLSRGDDIEGSYRNELITRLQDYIGIVQEMSVKYCTALVPLSSIFRDIMNHKPSFSFSDDRIHPNRTGHMVIAEAVYSALSAIEGK